MSFICAEVKIFIGAPSPVPFSGPADLSRLDFSTTHVSLANTRRWASGFPSLNILTIVRGLC
jgi:hypothetical protein